MSDITVGYALCGSFCTFRKSIDQMKFLIEQGYRVLPVMSQNAYTTDTRFGKAQDFIQEIEGLCGNPIIHTIVQAEPIGPKKMMDILVISPCTGNTLAKLNNAITDTSVTMAAKSHLRIGRLSNTKNIYLVPFSQDDPEKKTNSLVAHFDLLPASLEAALQGKQIQPMVL